nr:sphingoid long-chain base transporter rsb1 [Quercus suber]
MAVDPFANCNPDILAADCTLETCCLAQQASFTYIPNYGGNLFFTIFFAVFILPQIGLGVYYKTWGFMVGNVIGLVLEVIGYASRLSLRDNPFSKSAFLGYLIPVTIAPVFISAAIYLCLTRIIVVHGDHLSRVQPRIVAIAFMSSDFLSLLLQAIGGAITSSADTNSSRQTGVDIMIAGLLLQSISLGVFLIVVLDFALRARRGVMDMDATKFRVRNRTLFRAFLVTLLLATIAVLIRSIFRVAELWGGFEGPLWNSETDTLILDGAMIALAAVLLTLLHPGPAFNNEWDAAHWSLKTKPSAQRGRNNKRGEKVASDAETGGKSLESGSTSS